MTLDLGKLPPAEYQGVRIHVHRVRVPALGQGGGETTVERDMVVHPGAVVILPILPGPRVVMIRNPRYAVGGELWELPAGTLGHADPAHPTEDPAACAARELIEETGYRAGRMTQLIGFYSAPGFCNEYLTAFLAQDLEFVGQAPDEGEAITAHPVDWTQAIAWARSGELRDAKTLATLLWAQCFLAQDWA